MNEGLFEKYSKVIRQKKSEKEELVAFIKETTGIEFNEEEIAIQKKNVAFHTSSVKKTILHSKKIRDFFIEKGYELKF